MEARETNEFPASNPYFEIIASGNFNEQQVAATLVPPKPKPPELIEESKRVWNEKNQQRIDSGKPSMRDNSQLALKEVKAEDGKLLIEVYSAKYSDLIAMQDPSVKSRFSEYAPQILGTNVIAKTADGKLVIAQRGLTVATKPGAMSVPGGYPDLTTDLSGEDSWAPFSTVRRELQEEAGIDASELGNIRVAGIINNKTVGNPSMIFFAETSLTADEIEKRTTDKEINVKILADTKKGLEHAILWWAFSPSPSGASALALYGREKYGDEWYNWINERLRRRDSVYSNMTEQQQATLNKRAAEWLTKQENKKGEIKEFEKFSAEALSEGKAKNNPSKNEDLFVLDQNLIAVVDGATPKGNLSFGEQTGGQYAASLVKEALEQEEASSLTGQELVDYISKYMEADFEKRGYLSSIEGSPEARPTASFAAAKIIGDKLLITQVGDVSFRVNGFALNTNPKEIDRINAEKRRETIENIKSEEPNIEHEELLKRGREAIIEALNNQVARLQNNPDDQLGFGAMDGRSVPEKFVRTFTYDLKSIGLLEVFSDGYFKVAEKPTLDSWEDGFKYVEREDPDKIGEFPSTKGSTQDSFTDDRTVVIVRFK